MQNEWLLDLVCVPMSLLVFGSSVVFFYQQDLNTIVAGNEERYTHDWYARHRTKPVDGSDGPGKRPLFTD